MRDGKRGQLERLAVKTAIDIELAQHANCNHELSRGVQ